MVINLSLIFKCGFINHYLINSNDINLFKIIKHCVLTIEDYIAYLMLNPLFINIFNIIPKTKKNINLNDLFKQPLTIYNFNKIKHPLIIPNLYIKKPILLRNYLSTKLYKDAFDIFKKNYGKDNTYNTMKTAINNNINKPILEPVFFLNRNDNIEIYQIYFNPGNCKYTFIIFNEYINDTNTDIKIIIWIVPINATDSEYIDEIDDPDFNFDNENKPTYIGNFMDLNSTHLGMLEELQKIYNENNKDKNKQKICFFHKGSLYPAYFCLHLHIYNNNNYLNLQFINEQGIVFASLIELYTCLNNLYWNKLYYNNFKSNIFKAN